MAVFVLKKRVKWGLLYKPRNPRGKWAWVLSASYIFDTMIQAFEQANEFNISDSGYVYKPMRVEVTAKYEECPGSEVVPRAWGTRISQ